MKTTPLEKDLAGGAFVPHQQSVAVTAPAPLRPSSVAEVMAPLPSRRQPTSVPAGREEDARAGRSSGLRTERRR